MIIILAVIVAVLSLALLLLINFFEGKKKLDQKEYRDYWQTKIMVNLDDSGKYKLAVIEADKLVDRAFKERGLRGQTMGERLVSAGEFLSDKEAVWQAHKLRNRLVHEMDIELSLVQTKKALASFARALKDLGAL